MLAALGIVKALAAHNTGLVKRAHAANNQGQNLAWNGKLEIAPRLWLRAVSEVESGKSKFAEGNWKLEIGNWKIEARKRRFEPQ
jgi:hypothetical protein